MLCSFVSAWLDRNQMCYR